MSPPIELIVDVAPVAPDRAWFNLSAARDPRGPFLGKFPTLVSLILGLTVRGNSFSQRLAVIGMRLDTLLDDQRVLMALKLDAAVAPQEPICPFQFRVKVDQVGNETDLPALTGPGSELVYAASWFMGNPSLGTMISGAGGR